MYLPRHFSAPDDQAVDTLVRDYPLASLVCAARADQPPSVNPVVLACEGKLVAGARLLGHIARANPLAQTISEPTLVLAIFTGARAYVSPNWYPSKQRHHRVVPTYNYCTVVVHGTISRIDDPQQKLDIVRSLTDRMEQNQPQPWSVDDAPVEYIEQMLRAIVGVQIEVSEVQAKFKISQNRDDADREGVLAHLQSDNEASDAGVMAKLMQQLQSH